MRVSLLVGQPRHVGRGVLLRERPQGLDAGGEVLEEDALVDALARRRAHAQRQL